MFVLVAGCGFEVANFVVGSQKVRGDCGRHGQSEVLVEVALVVCGLVQFSKLSTEPCCACNQQLAGKYGTQKLK